MRWARFLFFLGAATGVSAQYLIQTVAGSSFDGDGGQARSALLIQPEGVAQDAKGNLYLADAADHRVRKVFPDGTIQTIAGIGVPGFAGDGGPAASAELNRPYGISLDAAGNLYIADLGNQRIRMVSRAGTITTVAGGGALSASIAPASARKVALIAPRNVYAASDGSVYFSDFGGQQVFLVTNGRISAVAGNGTAGDTGDGGPAVAAELNYPAGLAVDPAGNLYIADSGNNAIREVTKGNIRTVASAPAPTGLALDAYGNPFVAGSGMLGSPLLPGTSTMSGNDLLVDSSNNIVFSTGHTVQKLSPLGDLAVLAGNGSGLFFGDGAAASLARLNNPWSVAESASGALYIADTGNNRVRAVDASGKIETVAGTGDPSVLSSPSGVVVDSSGNVYIADTGNGRVVVLSPSGAFSQILTQLKAPSALALDGSGNLFVADRGDHRIIESSPGGGTTVVATVKDPIALAVDSSGTLYVSDNSQNALLQIPSGGSPAVFWQGLNAPAGVAVDNQGNVFVSDIAANRIRQISPGGSVTTIAGTGAPDFSGDGGLADAAAVSAPAGLFLDPAGNLFAADSGNDRVRKLTPAQTPIVPPPSDTAPPVTVVNAASNIAGPVAPGEIVSLYGSGFDPSSIQVTFNGAAATIFFAGASQINALVPASLSAGSAAAIVVTNNGATVAASTVSVAAAAPAVFTKSGGTGQAAALNQDGSANSTAHPAARGSIVTLFATGQGVDLSSASLLVGGVAAPMLYAGPAPGFQGLMQINARIPAAAPSGTLPVILAIGSAPSQPGVTVAVR